MSQIDRRNKKQAGLSLLEILVTAVIFVVIASAIIGLLISGKQTYDFGTAQVNVESEARRALDDISRELRQASGAKITGVSEGASGNSIVFQIPWDIDGDGDVVNALGAVEWSNDPGINRIGTIGYSLVGGQILRNLSFTAEQRVLANNIASLSFSRPAGTNSVIISLTAEKYVSAAFTGPTDRKAVVTLNTQVRLRN